MIGSRGKIKPSVTQGKPWPGACVETEPIRVMQNASAPAPRHAPLLTTLKPGEVRVQTESGEELLFWVGGGALEVQPHKVTILADTAARAKDLDEAAALAAKQRAEEALRDRTGAMEIAEPQAELARAAAQLRAIEKLRQLRKGG